MDIIQRFPEAKHILVVANGSFYTFDVYDRHDDILEPVNYIAAFKRITEMSKANKSTNKKSGDIGALTSLDRDTWTQARQHLVELGNDEVLKVLDSALFAICLDDIDYDQESDPMMTVRELCCGSKPENRWFDKSFSLIFSKNGLVGVNFEHAWGDGVAIMRFLDEMINDSHKNAWVNDKMDLSKVDVEVHELEIRMDNVMVDFVNKAKRDHAERLNAVEFQCLIRPGFGKTDCKKAKVGPDAVMQTAFQIAHHKVHGRFAAAYESCSTAIFRHGRTETMRPLTSDQRACVEGFVEGRPDTELLNLLQKCSQSHMDMTKKAAQG